MSSAADFARALKAGRRIDGVWFVVYVTTGSANEPRLGLVVGKRVAARAVDRNRVKRTVREAFRRLLRGSGPVDVVVRLKRLPAALEWAPARSDIQRLFLRVAGR